MTPSIPRGQIYQARTVSGLLRLACWAGAWTAATLLMKAGPALLGTQRPEFMLVGVALYTVVGAGFIVAQKNWLRGMDELQRKIYVDALGLTLGVTVVAGVAYEYLDKQGLLAFHFSDLLILTSLTLVGSVAYGTWRYR